MSDHIRTGSGGGNHITSPGGGMHGGGSDHQLQHVGGGGGCPSGGSGHMVGIPDADGFIYDPRDADVLCGRGGAALRHPGNQTYRRLVSLNKGLYVTCLKTEKLKISRSIVAAIREQNGRFLEKDNDRNAWYDIGEKKAVEKTSQALREGAPKLRQKMAELTPYGGSQQQQQQPHDIDPYDHLPDPNNSSNSLSYGQQSLPSSDVQLLAAAAERERLLQQQDLFRTERLLRQQSSSMGNSNHSSGTVGLGGLVAPPMQQHQHQQQQRAPQHGDLQPVVPGPNGLRNSMTSTTSSSSSANNMMNPHLVGAGMNNNNPGGGGTTTHSRHKDLQMDMMRRLSLHDMQQQIHATQQAAARRSSGLLNSRVSLARELGISESQLSLMSEFSTMSSSISGISGISGAGRPSMTFPSVGDNNNAARSGRAISALTGGGVGDMDYVSSYLNGGASSAAAYPPQLQQQQQLPQPASHNYSFRQQPMSAANLAAEAAAAVNGSDMDRRRVFAKMKYSRPPSVRSIKGQPAPTGPQQPQGQQHPQSQQQQQSQQHQGHSIRSIDDMPDFEMVESNLSLFSLSSKISLLDMKPAATAVVASLEPNQSNANLPHNPFGQNQQQQLQQHHRPQHHDDQAYGAAAAPAQPYQHRVIVESALSNRSDFLSHGSRHSIMSGLSKISDSSIDNSIFSDLSRKIGNVSTRSVAMSEMSVMDMQDMDDVLGDTRSGAEDVAPPLPPILPGGQQSMFLSSTQRQKPSSMDFDMLR
jgi:hypothetical protein